MSFHISEAEGRFLIQLARKSIEEYLKSHKRINTPEDTPPKMLQPFGVFVTINTLTNGKKELRGCIGYPYPTAPLVEAVIDSAINAAAQDPRFPPISSKELDHVVLEVSVLTSPEIIKVRNPKEYCANVKVGEDGLIIERGMYKGLLLPQVPVEWGWDEETFLCQCCIKAGLTPDSWLVEDTKIYKFSCVIAQEISPRGPVGVTDMRTSARKR